MHCDIETDERFNYDISTLCIFLQTLIGGLVESSCGITFKHMNKSVWLNHSLVPAYAISWHIGKFVGNRYEHFCNR